jgi:DNA modification methylase
MQKPLLGQAKKEIEMKTEHKLICGDCVTEMKNLPRESIDLIITDPPYNVGIDYGVYKDEPSRQKEYMDWCKSWLDECIRLLKRESSFYLFNYPENNAKLLPFLEEKLDFRRWLTWHYPINIGHSPKNYTRAQRSILFLTKGDNYTFNREDIAVPYKNPTDKRIQERIKNGSNGRAPYDTFEFNIVKNVSKDKTNHPCQIPTRLLEIFIKASSNQGDWVLDPFAGSFSTSTIAKELDRNSVGIDINPEYVEIGRHRLAKIKPLINFI